MKIERDEISVGVSKIKALIYTIIAFGFFVVLVWGFLKVETLPYAFNRTFLIICISLLIITSCLCFFSGLAKLTDKTQGLIISNNGLKINFGPNRGDFIQWDEITGLKIHNPIRGSMFLLIFIKNPEGILTKRRGLNRILLKMNNISHKTPVSLTSNWLDCNFDDLVTMIEDKYKRYGAQHKVEKWGQDPKPMKKIYTKRAIMIGTFLGGPLVAGYLIAENFKVFDEKDRAIKAWIYSIIITVLIFGSLFIIPNTDKLPNIIIPLILTSFAVFIIQKYQETKIKTHLNDGGQTYNLWRTTGIGIIGSIIILLPVLGYVYFSERNSEFYNTTKTYGITKNSIIYDKKGLTEKEIDYLASVFQTLTFFNNEDQRYVYVKKVGINYELSITVENGTEKNSDVIEPFMQLRKDIQSLFPKNKIVINLVVESLDNVVKRLE